MLVQEGELIFDISAIAVEKLDKKGIPKPEGMSFVDLVIEEKDKIFLIEVKDPSQQGTPIKNKERFLRDLKQDNLINQKLVPKARDSYTYLHLMKRDNKPFIFVLLLGLDSLELEKDMEKSIELDEALLLSFQERLLKRIRKEAAQPWKRKYIKKCIVITTEKWPEYFSRYSIARKWKH